MFLFNILLLLERQNLEGVIKMIPNEVFDREVIPDERNNLPKHNPTLYSNDGADIGYQPND